MVVSEPALRVMRAWLPCVVALSLSACGLESNGNGSGHDASLSDGGGFGGFPGGSGGFGGFPGGSGGFGGFGGFPGGSGGFDGGVFDAGSACGFCPPAPATSVLSSFLTPCCMPGGGCGLTSGLVSVGCSDWTQPGVDDVFCPDTTAPIMGVTLAGCCLPEGRCGVSFEDQGLGCVDRRDIAPSSFFSLQGAVDIQCARWQLPDAGDDEDGGVTCVPDGRCDPVAECAVEGGFQFCVCPQGYADLSPKPQTGLSCIDINECLASGTCAEGTCVNTPGGFRCDVSP